MKNKTRFGALAPALALAAGLALAQTPAQPQQSTSSMVFDNWTRNCSTQTDKEGKTLTACEARAMLTVKDEKSGQQGVAAVVAFGRLSSDSGWQAIVQVPIAALLSAPLTLSDASGRAIMQLPYVACQPQVCNAQARLEPAQLAALKDVGAKLVVNYRNQVGQDLKIEADAAGLAAALASVEAGK